MASPIESMLRAALLELAGDEIIDATVAAPVTIAADNGRLALAGAPGALSPVTLFAQARCLGYKVDLLLWHTTKSAELALAIECDGFEYHERTPHDASYDRARDRELLRAGLHVIRFLGRDINRDANQCAREITQTWGAIVGRTRAIRDGKAAAATPSALRLGYELSVVALLADHPMLVCSPLANRAADLITDERLRGMYSAAQNGGVLFDLAPSSLPPALAARVQSGNYRNVREPAAYLALIVAAMERDNGTGSNKRVYQLALAAAGGATHG